MTDEIVIDRIVDVIKPSANDVILEIGPGRGALTRRLLPSGAKVVAIELDRQLVPHLRELFAGAANLEIVEADALTFDYHGAAARAGGKLRIAANLPYYISTAILRRLIDFRADIIDLHLMLQLEVVERITATAGDSSRGFLTVLIEAFFNSTKLFEIPPSAFSPRPKVKSAFVALKPRASLVDVVEFERLASCAFRQKRKTLLNNLKNTYGDAAKLLESANILPTRRAETLTADEWLALLKVAPRSS